MKLEIGKQYKTRSGDIVTILKIVDGIDAVYPYLGCIQGENRLEGWKVDGRFNVLKSDSPFDLIEEL